MTKYSGSVPPRYGAQLRLSMAAAVLRIMPWIPYCLAYFLPLGIWSKLLIVFCPVMWYVLVEPTRVRYGQMMQEAIHDSSVPLRARQMFVQRHGWQQVFLGRMQLSWRSALPFTLLSVGIVLTLTLAGNVFASLKLLLGVSVWIASAAATAVNALPRVLMGESPVVDAGILGGGIALALLFMGTFVMMLWGSFKTSGYRFGYTRMPRGATIKPLLRKNLPLWLPTLFLLAAFAAVSYQELLFLLSNILSVATIYPIKPKLIQLVLLGCTALSYFVLLPIRKWNTAKWAAGRL